MNKIPIFKTWTIPKILLIRIDMVKSPASEDTINHLCKIMGDNFEILFHSLCINVDAIKQLKVRFLLNNIDYCAKLLLTMLEIKAFIATVQLDLVAFLRADFRAKHPFEKRINLKYVNVAILEGCKYIQGFGKDSKHGKLSELQKIGQLNDDRELCMDVLLLKNSLDDFLKLYNNLHDKTNRDLALHYDQNPMKVYEFLEQISEEAETDRVNKWFDVLNVLSQTADKYIKKYKSILPQNLGSSIADIDIYKLINNFSDEDNKIYNSAKEGINTYSKHLDSIIRSCRLSSITDKVKDLELPIDVSSISQFCQPLIQDIYPVIHIHYIYLDLACALKAFLISESFVERQLNLRRITVILYDGFARIYGYNDEQQNQSFWKAICLNLQHSEDIKTQALLIQTQTILDDLSRDKSINNPNLRECFIHYRKDNVDNVIKLYDETIKAFPIEEMTKSVKLLHVLPNIINLNSISLSVVNRNLMQSFEKKQNDTKDKLYSILDMIQEPELKQKFKSDVINKFEDMFKK